MQFEMNFKTATIKLNICQQQLTGCFSQYSFKMLEKSTLIPKQSNKLKQELNLQDQANETATFVLKERKKSKEKLKERDSNK